MPRVLGAAATALLIVVTHAAAQESRPGQYRSFVFVDSIATRGAQCGRLSPWQEAVLHAQVRDGARNWSEAHRTQLHADAASDAASRACNDEIMLAWIEGAERGMESEMLAHYIVAYSALSQMAPPAALFTETTQIADHAAARAAIDAKIAELDAAGAVAEGGQPWRDFVARTSAAVQEMARAYDAGEAPGRREQAEAWIRDTVAITELWLADAER